MKERIPTDKQIRSIIQYAYGKKDCGATTCFTCNLANKKGRYKSSFCAYITELTNSGTTYAEHRRACLKYIEIYPMYFTPERIMEILL